MRISERDLRVHGGFAELLRVHLAEALEARDLDLLALELGPLELGAVGVVAGVGRLGARGQAVERRLGEEQMAAADQLGHFLEEEGHQQGRDMGAVDVGVGHDDDPLVAQRVLGPFVAGAAAQRLLEVGDFLVGADLVGGGRGDVQDLAADRQDRLGLAVARLLGRAAGAVALDDEQLGAFGVVIGAVGELAGQAQLAGAESRSCA